VALVEVTIRVGVLGRAQWLYGVRCCVVFLSNHWHGLLWVEDAEQLALFTPYVDDNLLVVGARGGRLGEVGWRDLVQTLHADRGQPETAQVDRLRYLLKGRKAPTHWAAATALMHRHSLMINRRVA
jgi:hypothetical protein